MISITINSISIIKTTQNMNNEITLQENVSTALGNEIRHFANSIETVFAAIATWYSGILEQNVTAKQAKALVMAQVAFFAMVFPADLGMVYRAASIALFAGSLLLCKQRMAE